MYLLMISLLSTLSFADTDIIKLINETAVEKGVSVKPVLAASVSRTAFSASDPDERRELEKALDKEEAKRAALLCGHRKLIHFDTERLDTKAAEFFKVSVDDAKNQIQVLDFVDQPKQLGEVDVTHVQFRQLPYTAHRPALGFFSSAFLKLMKGVGLITTFMGLSVVAIEPATGFVFLVAGQGIYHVSNWGLDRKFSYNSFNEAHSKRRVVQEFYGKKENELTPDPLKFKVRKNLSLTKEQFETHEMRYNTYFTSLTCSDDDASPLIRFHQHLFLNDEGVSTKLTKTITQTWNVLNPFAWFRNFRAKRARPAN